MFNHKKRTKKDIAASAINITMGSLVFPYFAEHSKSISAWSEKIDAFVGFKSFMGEGYASLKSSGFSIGDQLIGAAVGLGVGYIVKRMFYRSGRQTQIEGLQHKGMAGSRRNQTTDFGSGWQGLPDPSQITFLDTETSSTDFIALKQGDITKAFKQNRILQLYTSGMTGEGFIRPPISRGRNNRGIYTSPIDFYESRQVARHAFGLGNTIPTERQALEQFYKAANRKMKNGPMNLGGWNIEYDINAIKSSTAKYKTLSHYQNFFEKNVAKGKLNIIPAENYFFNRAWETAQNDPKLMAHLQNNVDTKLTSAGDLRSIRGWNLTNLADAFGFDTQSHFAHEDVRLEEQITSRLFKGDLPEGFFNKVYGISESMIQPVSAEAEKVVQKVAVGRGNRGLLIGVGVGVGLTIAGKLAFGKREDRQTQITGLSDTGISPYSRHRQTDFGSGWRGIQEAMATKGRVTLPAIGLYPLNMKAGVLTDGEVHILRMVAAAAKYNTPRATTRFGQKALKYKDSISNIEEFEGKVNILLNANEESKITKQLMVSFGTPDFESGWENTNITEVHGKLKKLSRWSISTGMDPIVVNPSIKRSLSSMKQTLRHEQIHQTHFRNWNHPFFSKAEAESGSLLDAITFAHRNPVQAQPIRDEIEKARVLMETDKESPFYEELKNTLNQPFETIVDKYASDINNVYESQMHSAMSVGRQAFANKIRSTEKIAFRFMSDKTFLGRAKKEGAITAHQMTKAVMRSGEGAAIGKAGTAEVSAIVRTGARIIKNAL